jgi:tetratricopeptide (TPR) repeat protein
LRSISVAAVFAATILLTFFHVSNMDIGGHITVGREIVKTHAIPDRDFFTHTVKDSPYPVHQWLGQVTAFGVDHFFGVPGLILLRMALVLAGAWLLYRNARGFGAPVVVAAAIVLLLVVATRPRFFVRPFLVAWLFLPWLQFLLADVRSGRTRRLWPIIPIVVVWCHVHSGVLYGVLLLGGTIAGEAIKMLASRRGGRPLPGTAALDGWNLRRVVLFSGAAVVAAFGTLALVNPSGLKPLLLPILFLGNPTFHQMIGEYRTVDLMIDWPFDLVAGAVLLGILLRPKRVDLTELIVTVGFGILAYRSVRGILPFAVTAAPLLARTWGSVVTDALDAIQRGQGKPRHKMVLTNSVEAMLLLAVVGASSFVSLKATRDWAFPFGFGKDPRHYPERALDFLEAQNVQGPVFNTDVFASSLLWRWGGRRYPVFVDARLEAYPESFWRDTYYRVLEAAPGWRDVLDRYDVQFAMVRRTPGEADDKIGTALWEDPAWGVVFWDDYVLIFVRRGARERNDQVLTDWEFDAFSPRRPQDVRSLRGVGLVQAANELADLVEWIPNSFLPRWSLAASWTRLGRGEEALDLFTELAGSRLARDNRAFHESWAEAALVAGRRGEWERLLREAGGDPTSTDELFDAAVLLARAAKRGRAIDFYREVIERRPDDADAMNNMALLLAQEPHGIGEALQWIATALDQHPGDAYYIASRAEVRVRAGDVAGAIEDFQRSLDALAPDDSTARAEVEDWLKRLR